MDGAVVAMARTEFNLLPTLANHPLLTFTKEALVEAVRGQGRSATTTSWTRTSAICITSWETRSALVGSIGLVLAIPIATAIAVLVATAEPARRRHALLAPSGHTHAYR